MLAWKKSLKKIEADQWHIKVYFYVLCTSKYLNHFSVSKRRSTLPRPPTTPRNETFFWKCPPMHSYYNLRSSVKWKDPGNFLKAQGKFIFSFPCTLFFTYFWHLKITNWVFKKSPGLLDFALLWQGVKILFLDTFYFVFFKLSEYFLVS